MHVDGYGFPGFPRLSNIVAVGPLLSAVAGGDVDAPGDVRRGRVVAILGRSSRREKRRSWPPWTACHRRRCYVRVDPNKLTAALDYLPQHHQGFGVGVNVNR